MQKLSKKLTLCFLMLLICSCASTSAPPPPLTYLALEKPKEEINTKEKMDMEIKFNRGGLHFFNFGFRPAPDVKRYIEQVGNKANTNILRNADIKFQVPFYISLLVFGYTIGTDTITAKQVIPPVAK